MENGKWKMEKDYRRWFGEGNDGFTMSASLGKGKGESGGRANPTQSNRSKRFGGIWEEFNRG
jgi:hypothetical protein